MRAVPEGRTLGGNLARSSFCGRRGVGGQQLSAQFKTRSARVIHQKPEMTDAYEPFGEHVQKEATQELRGGKSHLTLFAAVGVILPSESDALLLEG